MDLARVFLLIFFTFLFFTLLYFTLVSFFRITVLFLVGFCFRNELTSGIPGLFALI